MSYRLLKVDVVGGLSKELLASMESLWRVPGERDLSKPRLGFILQLIKTGEFNRCEWATCYCQEDSNIYRVNGQHSGFVLTRIADGDIDADFPEGVPVLIWRYECDTLASLADVFDQFDHQKSGRSPSDKLGVFMAQWRDMVGIDKKLCGQVLSGIAWGLKRVPEIGAVCEYYTPNDAYDRGLLLNVVQVREFIDLMHQHSGAPFKEWQRRSGIVARLFDLFLEDRETAELAIEQLLYEAGDDAAKFTREIRSVGARVGKDQGYYYRKTSKYLLGAIESINNQGKEAIKALIREVMAEEESEEAEEAVPA